jgi:hypothetical protein
MSLSQEGRTEGRIASPGNRAPGRRQTSKNVPATRDDALAKLRCVSITATHNMVSQCSASSGNVARLKALEHVVCLHFHSAAMFFKFFATRYPTSAFRLSNIVVNGRDKQGN